MSAQELEKVVLMALLDREFRRSLLSEPEGVLKALNIEITPERVAALRHLSMEGFKRLAEAFGHPDAGWSRFN